MPQSHTGGSRGRCQETNGWPSGWVSSLRSS